MNIEIKPLTEQQIKWAPLALGFRPFFLLGIWFAVLLMAVSLGAFATGIWHYNYFDLSLWHAHEMVFGYATAVVAGFLLTATGNWTGLPTPSGKSLALLALLWLAPRLLSSVPFVPGVAFALLDLLFLPVLAVVIGRLILKAKQSHNYPVPLLLMGLAFCNGLVHLEVLGFVEQLSSQAMQIAVCLMLALIVVIAGRVVPFFMQKAIGTRPTTYALIEQFALPSALLVGLALAVDIEWLTVIATLIAAVVHGARLMSWFDRAVFSQPMLWVLHIGYFWLVAGFLIYGLSVWKGIPTQQAMHAWTVGAISMFTLGMMTRVALGHTGRAIEALAWMPAAFVLMFIATVARVLLPFINPDWLDVSVTFSAMCWIVAFVLVGIRYSSMLLRARVDGKEG
ncbi:MAG: NnrS family protein [Mariprofundus sp.]